MTRRTNKQVKRVKQVKSVKQVKRVGSVKRVKGVKRVNRDGFIAGKRWVKGSVRRRRGKGDVVRKSIFNTESGNEQRLQKVLAAYGFGSRRQCEEFIEQGRVEVDGVVASLGVRVDRFKSEIKVDGERLGRVKPVYIALFKPKGYVCTDNDLRGRPRVIDLAPVNYGRLFLVGRLDMDSEGLILLTNDGALAERLTHPRYAVPKVYRVQVAGEVTGEVVERVCEGVYLAEGFAKATNVVIRGRRKQSTILDLTLAEGKNREVRRLFAKLGHKVQILIRISVGGIKLGNMLPGEWRHLTTQEINKLYGKK
ncbi:MAG: rRNA pseudouridine synthase [Planctomycetaceae bacterium]|jgi:23S rRNA pseudouridine2605 synthase|nr:rRNA pseudouridine synthase [Planctomycetaceae bacterium]